MPLSEYIDDFVLQTTAGKEGGDVAPSSPAEAEAEAERGYLAQHPLFDQIPALRRGGGVLDQLDPALESTTQFFQKNKILTLKRI